jgi:hypothetical protein
MEDIRHKILSIRSTLDRSAFIDYFVEHPKEVDALAEFIFKLEEYPMKEYASWILTHICKSGRINVQYLYPKLVDVLFLAKDQSTLRNVANCINLLEVTDYRESELIDLLISFIKDFDNKVALQVYAIHALVQFVKRYPELLPELEEIIKFHAHEKTAAYGSAHRKFLKRTRKK